MIAKDFKAHAGLCEQFKAHSVRRLYQALVLREPSPPEGRVEGAIARCRKDRLKMALTNETDPRYSKGDLPLSRLLHPLPMLSFLVRNARPRGRWRIMVKVAMAPRLLLNLSQQSRRASR